MKLLTLFILACGCDTSANKSTDTAEPSPSVNWDCDPIAPSRCGLPFPSTYFMRASDTSATGWQVSLGETTIPINIDGETTSPRFLNEKDGFSPLTPVITHMDGATAVGLVNHTDLDAHLSPDARTIIIDLETGDRVPHFAEVDASAEWDFARILMLHPVIPLRHGGRYVIGIRGIENDEGEVIAASEAFVSLRDGAPAEDPRIEDRRPLYAETLFPALEAQGFERAGLQLAWDFVVASQEGTTGKALWMRNDLYERIAPEGPSYVIDTIEEHTNDTTAKRIKGHMFVPLYTDVDAPGALLNRDADGMPYAEGETRVPFTIIVPNTAIEDPRPLPLLQYGHGLLGSQGEAHGSYLSEFADTYGYIIFAVDWTGMKEEDAGPISLMLVTDLAKFAMIPERSQQGFIEFLAAMKMMKGAMVNDPALQAPDPTDPTISVPLIDPDHAYYYGNSQGGIMGGAYIALSPDIHRATLGVPGTPYHLLLSRSADFDPFFLIFKTMYPDPIDVQFILAMNQTLWDAGEASGYVHAVNNAPLADTPPKEVLLHAAIGDAQVTTLGAHIMARAYGASLIEDPVRPVWGLETVDSGHTGSALVEYDYGLDEPIENIPPDAGEDPHGKPRKDAAGQEQMHHFFETGVVHHVCEGPCSGS
jgi:hypothetical protein